MIRSAIRLLGAGALLALTACASTPVHYYTLVAPADSAAAPISGPASLPFELLPVSVPAQVDQPQLVVRQGGQGVALLEGQRWIAPLANEIRDALSADLARALDSRDISGLAGNNGPSVRIKLDLRRFDSQLGRYAMIEGAWSVRLMHGIRPASVSCTSRVSESVGVSYPGLVQGHQRAISQLAAQIAGAARVLEQGQTPTCPAG
jgi:uncharacterized lipoprotein YmbA